MSEFDLSAWMKQETSTVELSKGRVAVIRPLPANAIVELAELPVTAAVQEATAAGTTDTLPTTEILALMRDVIVAGTVQPKFTRSEQPNDGEVPYSMLGLRDAMDLFRAIMSLSKLDAEEVAGLRNFRGDEQS